MDATEQLCKAASLYPKTIVIYLQVVRKSEHTSL